MLMIILKKVAKYTMKRPANFSIWGHRRLDREMRAAFVMRKFSNQQLSSNSIRTKWLNQQVDQGKTYQPNSLSISWATCAILKLCNTEARIVFMLTIACST
jgi:hypothetical protein